MNVVGVLVPVPRGALNSVGLCLSEVGGGKYPAMFIATGHSRLHVLIYVRLKSKLSLPRGHRLEARPRLPAPQQFFVSYGFILLVRVRVLATSHHAGAVGCRELEALRLEYTGAEQRRLYADREKLLTRQRRERSPPQHCG